MIKILAPEEIDFTEKEIQEAFEQAFEEEMWR